MSRLLNRTRGTVLAARVERARTFGARLAGLLGRASLAEGDALVLEPCTSVHTFFMKFAIDVAFVDREGRVARAVPALRPFRATRIHPSAVLAVELSSGALARSGTREGDLLAFEDV